MHIGNYIQEIWDTHIYIALHEKGALININLHLLLKYVKLINTTENCICKFHI